MMMITFEEILKHSNYLQPTTAKVMSVVVVVDSSLDSLKKKSLNIKLETKTSFVVFTLRTSHCVAS